MEQVFIAGCGYIGERVAKLLQAEGSDVTCLVRTEKGQEKLQSAGFKVAAWNLDSFEGAPEIELAGKTVLYFVPPQGGGTVDLRARNFLRLLTGMNPPARLVYASATTVYSGAWGERVTEESETVPTTAMGKRRLDAERQFLEYGKESGTEIVILRISGIYGAGRLPLMQVSQGQPVLRIEESGPSNRIHADDLATICIAAARGAESGEIFNVSDNNPCSMTEYFNAVADLLEKPRQPQVTMEEAHRVMTPLMLSYVSHSQIVDSGKLFRRLGIKLKYPTTREGLAVSRQ